MENLESEDSILNGRLIIKVEQDQGTVIKVWGELDYATRHKLHAVIESLLAQNVTTFALDLNQIEFIDSSGLGLLIMTKRQVDGAKGCMPVVLNERIDRLLETMQLATYFDRKSTIQEALEEVRTAGSA